MSHFHRLGRGASGQRLPRSASRSEPFVGRVRRAGWSKSILATLCFLFVSAWSLPLVAQSSGVTPSNQQQGVVAGEPHHLTLDGPETMEVGGSGALIRLTVRDANGHPVEVSTGTEIHLETDAEGDGTLFSPSSALTIPVGVTTVSFRYSTTSVQDGIHGISARASSGPTFPVGASASHELLVQPGDLAGFRVEADGGGEIGVQTVGCAFQVRVTALDDFQNRKTDFSGTVTLSAEVPLSSGSTTPPFQDGVLDGHEIVIHESGRYTLTAFHHEDPAAGASEVFTVVSPGGSAGVVVDVDNDRPAPNDTVTVAVRVTNWGTEPLEEVSVQNPLTGQARLSALAMTTERGGVDDGTGLWMVGRLEPGEEAVLWITALVVSPGSVPSNGQTEDS